MGLGKSFDVRCGKRLVSVRDSSTPREAVIEYPRTMACSESEMTTLSRTAITWRGAVYRAVPRGSAWECSQVIAHKAARTRPQ